MVRKGCCPKEGLNRGAWTNQEDKLLSDYIKVHGLGRWRNLPAKAGLNRCGKSCRLRWLNYLRPDIKRGNIAEEEEELIIRLHKLLGNRWSLIAGRLPGRTDNEIKNYWNTYLRKKASDHRSEHHSSTETKKDPSKDSSSELKECSEVNVIRTKAVRCTRPLFEDPFPSIVTNNYQDSLVPTDPLDPNFLWDFDGSNAAPLSSNEGVDGFSMMEMMRNSFFAKDGFCMDSDGLYNIDSIDAIVNEDNHVGGGIYNGEMDEGEGLYSFLDDVDAWDSITMPQ